MNDQAAERGQQAANDPAAQAYRAAGRAFRAARAHMYDDVHDEDFDLGSEEAVLQAVSDAALAAAEASDDARLYRAIDIALRAGAAAKESIAQFQQRTGARIDREHEHFERTGEFVNETKEAVRLADRPLTDYGLERRERRLS